MQDEEKKSIVSLGLKSRERKCALSLDFRLFVPSVLDGARSKVALHGEGYAWMMSLKTHLVFNPCF